MTPAKRLAARVLSVLMNDDEACRLARLILRKPPRSPAAEIKGPSRAMDKAKRKRWLDAETAEIRTKVRLRANGFCERCKEALGILYPPFCGQLHHLRGGSGRRCQQQSAFNSAWLCAECHRWMHANPKKAREWAKDFISAQHPGATS